MMQNKAKKIKPILYDPQIIPRVKQYLEENVHQTYVDVAVMARQLQERYREYNRRKSAPFRQLVEKAYKTVLYSYGIESNPSSEENEGGNSDLEMMEVPASPNHMNNMLTNMYNKNQKTAAGQPGNDNEAIDISSDESGDEEKNGKSKKQTGKQSAPGGPLSFLRVATNSVGGVTKTPSGITITKVKDTGEEEQPASKDNTVLIARQPLIQVPKRRKLDHNAEVPKIPPLTPSTASTTTQPGSATATATGTSGGTAASGGGTAPAPGTGSNAYTIPALRMRRFKKEVQIKQPQIAFRDIGGMDRVLKQLCELLFHIKRPEIYLEIGLSPPRGFLLHGPPGCGKTMLAQAIAGQLSIGFIEVPATELIAGVSGESEERIREVFEQACNCAPCVLFIDEIDAISSNRLNAQKDMERRIVAQLISCFDGLANHENGEAVVVIGATNRPEALDPGLRRVGRFDHEISLGIPDRKEREEILIVVCETLNLERCFDYRKIAELTPGYVGADLLALASRAASIAVKRKYFSYLNKVRAQKLSKNIPVVDLVDDTVVENDENNEQAQKSQEEKSEQQTQTTAESAPNQEGTSNEPPAENTASKTTTTGDENEPTNTENPQEQADNPESMEVDSSKEPEESEKTENVPEAEETIDVDEISDIPEDYSTKPMKDPSLAELIAWLHPDNPPVQDSQLVDFFITMDDFLEALKVVQPSAKREGFITVPDVTWEDIGSLRDIREELQLAVLAPVKYPEKMKALGLNSPSGVLLCGPPGCGKTLLAKAIANEAGINFISVKGPELMNMYVGESERAVRQCFQRARNSAPCVIFFDEFDSLCPKRSDSVEGGSGTRIVNQLLTEMDGIEERRGVFLMAATNRPDIIDPAILRPGRLDMILYVGLPAAKDRVEILEALTKHRTQPVLAEDVNLERISELTQGFTGADLAGLIRQASLLTLKESISNPTVQPDELKVTEQHFLSALKLVKPSVSPEERKIYEKLRMKYAAPRAENANL